MSRRCAAFTLGAATIGACACVLACGGDDAARPQVLSPGATSRSDAFDGGAPLGAGLATGDETTAASGADESRDAGWTQWSTEDAALHVPAPRAVPEPAYGATEPPRPGDPHAFRLAVSMRAMRASPSGAKIVKMLSVIPDVIDAKTRTGVDPCDDAEWLLVYGSKAAVPGPNANVMKHGRPEAIVTKAIADAGFEPWQGGDAGTTASGAAGGRANVPAGAVRADLYGVRDVLVRPQPGVLALVPGDRAQDLAGALAKPVDPGVKPGELARVLVAEPSKLARFVPAEVAKATVIVKPAADGGLDATAEADCRDAASCAATATSLDDLAKRSNSLMVRIATRNILGGLAVRADGTKLKATVHAAPDQVNAIVGLLRAQLGLPAADPGDQTHRP